MMRRKSPPSENVYLKNNGQTNISKLGRGKGCINFFIINEIKMYFVYMSL